MTTQERFSSRPVEGSVDLSRMYDLALLSNAPTYTLDLPWRFATPATRVPAWTHLWEEPDGELVAWGVLQFPFHSLDFAVRSEVGKDERQDLVLAWAVEQLTIVATDVSEDLPFYISGRDHDANRIAAIERAGFALRPGSFIGMERDLAPPIPDAKVPTGITIRPLNAPNEVPSYVAVHGAAFESDDMTAKWRESAIDGPHYTPGLDLVVVAADGTVAGFCICWLGKSADGQTVAQIEPLGVSPAFHRKGMGRALLLEAMKCSKAHDAQRLAVYVASYNDAAIAAYKAVGFRTAYHLRVFLRTFGEGLSQLFPGEMSLRAKKRYGAQGIAPGTRPEQRTEDPGGTGLRAFALLARRSKHGIKIHDPDIGSAATATDGRTAFFVPTAGDAAAYGSCRQPQRFRCWRALARGDGAAASS